MSELLKLEITTILWGFKQIQVSELIILGELFFVHVRDNPIYAPDTTCNSVSRSSTGHTRGILFKRKHVITGKYA